MKFQSIQHLMSYLEYNGELYNFSSIERRLNFPLGIISKHLNFDQKLARHRQIDLLLFFNMHYFLSCTNPERLVSDAIYGLVRQQDHFASSDDKTLYNSLLNIYNDLIREIQTMKGDIK